MRKIVTLVAIGTALSIGRAALAQNLNFVEEGYVELSHCSVQCMVQIRDGRNRLAEHSDRMRRLLDYAAYDEEVTDALASAAQLEYCGIYQDNARSASACLNACQVVAAVYQASDFMKEVYLDPLSDFVLDSTVRGSSAGIWNDSNTDMPEGSEFQAACDQFWANEALLSATGASIKQQMDSRMRELERALAE